ncbi:hypothetical protein A33K_17577 [Burkholderia humptydooensis MSMB43]|uniref:Transposase n=1 Tax=Burkholderia humptydooensis MSMB43 TaxID=441157 RepID=A0ABN0FZZ7_9BURK|nr:hypothetical protein A33K_17577 [Burkholderia humptydooensis MSMB43]
MHAAPRAALSFYQPVSKPARASQRPTCKGARNGIADRIRDYRVHLFADFPQVMQHFAALITRAAVLRS